MYMKKINKFSKIFLLIATLFSYIASPVAVLADVITSMPLNMQLEAVDKDKDGYIDNYKLTYISANNDYDELKTYDIELNSTFTYINGDVSSNTILIEDITGNTLNNMRSSCELDPISKYYNGTYSLDVTVYDDDEVVYEDNYLYNYSTFVGLTGNLSGVVPTDEVRGANTTGNYDVTVEGEYTQNLSILTGELSPNGKYRVVYDEENTSEVMSGEELRGLSLTGTVTNLTGKLAGNYSYTDTVTIEELEEDEVINTYTYCYNANVKYGTNNDELFSNMYGVTFKDGYMFVNAKELYETESVITLGEIINALVDTDITLEVLDEEENTLDLTSDEVLLYEVKNGYVLEFTNGASVSYMVVVKGDTTFDNTFNTDDLTGVMEGYLNEENMPSMDMVTLEETIEGETEPVKEEFGTITFEDILFTNELLKENGNTNKEELDDTGLKLNFGEVLDEIYVGDTFEVEVLVNSEDALDYIDGIDGLVTTSDNLKLTDVKFNELFTGTYNDDGRFVGVGTELVSGEVVMTLVFTAVSDGSATIGLSGKTSKFLNIDEFEKLTKEVVITRNLSTNNNLSSLNASVGTFDVNFDKDVTVYTLTVPYDTKTVILSGALEDALSEVDGLIEYELTEDKTTAIINVTAEDGTVKTYTVYIIKESKPVTTPVVYYYSSNNYLKSLSIDGYELTFDKYTNEYKITVKNSVTSLDITALAEDYRARVEITGNEGFKEGENTVIITVTAEDGSTREYKLVVDKEDKKQAVTEIEDSSNTTEKIVIIVLIVLVVLGLLYLIFKKDDEEVVEVPTKKEESKNNNSINNNSKNNNKNKKK